MHCFYAFGFVLAFHGVAIGLYAKFYPVWCVSPRLTKDRERFPPNNILFRLFGAGLLWMSWTCFNGGDPCVVSTDASLAVLNTVDFERFHYELKQCFSLTHNPQKNIRMSECLYKDADIVAKIVIV
uniref:Ammonium transporter AmtB-like domain-containing protein n=1 Tax=Populus alba TaxID=43335 RepID=A0A4V6AAW2_POPAL|nr:ammonium transporter 3 member 1-like [Populus alba]TKS10786.1 hypothetical protein D5086_0000078510 [Populus alba]